MKPTNETYSELQQAYDLFNVRLFDGKLSECLITLQRKKSTHGYFSYKRFENPEKEQTDEIAMNPTYFAAFPLVEIMQTLVHEMCHLWQYQYGQPGRNRYHNKEWAYKMQDIGLMPSNTGKPGGKKTGDHMKDYPIENGLFLAAFNELSNQKFRVTWYDRYVSKDIIDAGHDSYTLQMDLSETALTIEADNNIEIVEPQENPSNRNKYTCGCGVNVWGKPNINIICGECGTVFEAQTFKV